MRVPADVRLRPETSSDVAAIHRVNVEAFGGPAEAEIVDLLREAGALTLSLVAERGGVIVGHIAFSEVTVDAPDGRRWIGVGLAPMAVAPAHQRSGVGGLLIEEGLARLRDAGHRFCVVLGHPAYYPRHGFIRASRVGLRWEHPARDEAFLVRALVADGLAGVGGVVRYRPEVGD